MARQVSLSSYQNMQRGEADALGDREVGQHDVATVDPMTGGVVDQRPGFRSPALSISEQLASLVLQDDISGMPLGQVVGLVRMAVAKAHVNATETEIRDEAERRRAERADADAHLGTGYGLEELPVEPKVEDRAEGSEQHVVEILADKHTRGLHDGMTIGGCPACGEYAGDGLDERVSGRAEVLAGKLGRGRLFDVAPDGIVEAVREPERTPDRGPDVGTTHHTVTDEAPRFSGGGVEDDDETSRLIPSDGAFLNDAHKAAPELANLADALMERHGFLERLRPVRIDYAWARKGSNSKGKRSIGKLQRVSGVWRRYCPFQFVVTLSADTARLAGFSDRQVEASLFHQLCHIDTDDKGNWIRVGHDFEGFGAEIREYGPWTEDLKIGGKAFSVATQLGLDLDDDEDEDEELEERRPREPFVGEPDTTDELPSGAEIDAAMTDRELV